MFSNLDLIATGTREDFKDLLNERNINNTTRVFLCSENPFLGLADEPGKFFSADRTFLGLACEFGNKELVEFALSFDSIDINKPCVLTDGLFFKGQKNMYPLFSAALAEREDIVDLLIEAGANVSYTVCGYTIIHFLCSSKFKDEEKVARICDKLIVTSRMQRIIRERTFDEMQTPLHICCKRGHHIILSHIIRHFESYVNSLDKYCKRAVDYAADHPKCLEVLKKYDSKIDGVDRIRELLLSIIN